MALEEGRGMRTKCWKFAAALKGGSRKPSTNPSGALWSSCVPRCG